MNVAVLPVSPPADLRIAECTALKLRRLARKVTQIYDEALAEHRLTVGQLGILAGLRRSRGIGISTLAELLSTDASTLSRLIRPLEKIGLLSIDADPDDGRAKLIRLTDTGFTRLRAAALAWQDAQDRVGELLGQPRLAALRYIVDDAFNNL